MQAGLSAGWVLDSNGYETLRPACGSAVPEGSALGPAPGGARLRTRDTGGPHHANTVVAQRP